MFVWDNCHINVCGLRPFNIFLIFLFLFSRAYDTLRYDYIQRIILNIFNLFFFFKYYGPIFSKFVYTKNTFFDFWRFTPFIQNTVGTYDACRLVCRSLLIWWTSPSRRWTSLTSWRLWASTRTPCSRTRWPSGSTTPKYWSSSRSSGSCGSSSWRGIRPGWKSSSTRSRRRPRSSRCSCSSWCWALSCSPVWFTTPKDYR